MAKTDKELKAKQEQEYKARIGDYLKTFTSAHGKRVLKDLRLKYDTTMKFGTPLEAGVSIGKREVVKEIEGMLLTGKNPQLIEDLFRGPEDDGFTL